MIRAFYLLILLACSCAAVGCSSTTRYVSARHWHEDQYLYIAYKDGRRDIRVVRCTPREDNTLDCVEQEAILKISHGIKPEED